MWIVPKNILNNKEYYLFATGTEVSKEEFQKSFPQELSLMWRSKPFKTSTWYQRWNRVWWIKHLFGRILKPSMQNRFITEYTESLGVIRAKGKATQVKESCGTMSDSFGLILKRLSSQQTLFGASSKTSLDTLRDLSPTFLTAYDLWVTQLKQDCLQRMKLARHTRENGSLYSRWATPRAFCYKDSDHDRGKSNLGEQVMNFPTPSARDYKGASFGAKGRDCLDFAVEVNKTKHYGQLNEGNHNTNGKLIERLNPEWAAQLMGTTFEQSFYASMATE